MLKYSLALGLMAVTNEALKLGMCSYIEINDRHIICVARQRCARLYPTDSMQTESIY
jgi:hypothetical protein